MVLNPLWQKSGAENTDRIFLSLTPPSLLSRGTRGCGGFCSLKAGPPAFYDFVVFTEKKRVEKLRYMHRNPVQRGLVLRPEDWLWSSFRHYAYGERGPVLVNGTQKAELHIRKIS